MMDIFEKSMPVIDSKGNTDIVCHCEVCNGVLSTEHFRQWFFRQVVPASPNLLFLLLTKRPGNINRYIPEEWKHKPPRNVMFGCSPVDQVTAEAMIPQLLRVNGNRFLSVEPQLAEINLIDLLHGIDWVIVGGESGSKKRPYNPAWGRFIRNDCEMHRVPFFFKQIDKVQDIPDDLMIREFPEIGLVNKH